MRHGIVLSAIDSSTLNSSAMDMSAMDSSAIGVDVAVLVVCKDLAARYLIFGISDTGAETATPKWGGLMRCEVRQHAITRCDLGGSGGMQNFLGVFWVSEIDSEAKSVVYSSLYRPAPLC